jgi:serine/threonine protein kinase
VVAIKEIKKEIIE